jgi:hypothetical protein
MTGKPLQQSRTCGKQHDSFQAEQGCEFAERVSLTGEQ